MNKDEKKEKLDALEQQMIQEERRSSKGFAGILSFLVIGLTANHKFILETPFKMSSGKPERGKIIYSGHTPRIYKKVGRNDLCPCDSEQKFKNCHGR